jgi:glutamine amidotransferase
VTAWALFDYGVGNLHSLQRSLERTGARPRITSDPGELVDADVAVLPGVGAFGSVMASLAPAADGLRRRHAEGRPILGVCIGLQALAESSEESPGVAGLGILPGTVRRLPAAAGKVPHMGWDQLEVLKADPTLEGVPTGSHVYYVHSYALVPGPETLARTTYGMPLAALVRSGNTVGTQFHPEKSGAVGARVLSNIVRVLEGAA